jgi:hypothetical protein
MLLPVSTFVTLLDCDPLRPTPTSLGRAARAGGGCHVRGDGTQRCRSGLRHAGGRYAVSPHLWSEMVDVSTLLRNRLFGMAR